jgi:hypothetical protein
MKESKTMEYESRKSLSDALKPRNIYIYIYIYFTFHDVHTKRLETLKVLK